VTAAHCLQLAGLAANVLGALLIAKEVIVASRLRDLGVHLFRSLWPRSGQPYAHVLADMSELGDASKGSIVRGTAFLLIGFLFQLASVLIDAAS
jgi:hypothetical protein